jgi:hypothetical protein
LEIKNNDFGTLFAGLYVFCIFDRQNIITAMPKTLIACLLALASVGAIAQNTPFHVQKWGSVSEEDLKMTAYPEDSTAAAVVLQDIGTMQLETPLSIEVSGTFLLNPEENASVVVEFSRFRRIKVLNVAAFDQGNLMIPFWSGSHATDLQDYEVEVFQPNGEKQKVKSENIFTETLNQYWSVKKIFIPNLQKGSIVEYHYMRKTRDIFTLPVWYFQDDLPVRWSQLDISIPYYLDYIFLSNTKRPFDLKESHQKSGLGNNSSVIANSYGMANMPAFKKEPYITTMYDYLAHISFELRGIHIVNGQQKTIMTSWADQAKGLEKWKSFGEQYQKIEHFRKIWQGFSKEITPSDKPDVLMEKALRFVSKSAKWNGSFSPMAYGELDDQFDKKTCVSADLNMALIAILRKAGLDAWPLLVSTRSHGVPFPDYPFTSQFSSVVALVRQGDQMTVLDATNPLRPIDELDEENYNGSGWIVQPDNPQWVSIKAPEKVQTWVGNLDLLETGAVKGAFTLVAGGPEATNWRTELEAKGAKEFLKKHFATVYPDVETDSIEVVDQQNLQKPVAIKFNCRIPAAANQANNLMYFNCRGFYHPGKPV